MISKPKLFTLMRSIALVCSKENILLPILNKHQSKILISFMLTEVQANFGQIDNKSLFF